MVGRGFFVTFALSHAVHIARLVCIDVFDKPVFLGIMSLNKRKAVK